MIELNVIGGAEQRKWNSRVGESSSNQEVKVFHLPVASKLHECPFRQATNPTFGLLGCGWGVCAFV